MTGFRRWHLLLLPVPIIGWGLLAGYLLDAWLPVGTEPRPAHESEEAPRSAAPTVRRLFAGAVDFALAASLAAVLPPAFAWALGSAYLLFRDGGRSPVSVGKRLCGVVAGDGSGSALPFTTSFARNLPLIALPYAGPLIEAALVVAGRPRLGDRLAGTSVR